MKQEHAFHQASFPGYPTRSLGVWAFVNGAQMDGSSVRAQDLPTGAKWTTTTHKGGERHCTARPVF